MLFVLRLSTSIKRMDEIKKTKKLCKDNGFYFDIKPDVSSAVEKAVEEAKAMVEKEKKDS